MPRRRLQSTTRTSKSNRLNRQNNNSARASRIFLYISLPSLHDYDGKFRISRFMEDVNKRQLNFFFLFLNLNMVLSNSAEKELAWV